MGLFGFGKNINTLVEEARATEGAVLVDVREQHEFKKGHIPGARNIPLSKINKIERVIPQKDKPLYVYCLSGARANKATSELKKLGYTDLRSIGGIQSWKGSLEY